MEKKKTDAGKIVLIVMICWKALGIIVALLSIVTMFITMGLTGLLALFMFESVGTNNVILLGDYEKEIRGFEEQLFDDYNDFEEYFSTDEITPFDFKYNNIYVFEVYYNPCGEVNLKPTAYFIEKEEEQLNVKFEYTKSCRRCGTKYRYYAVKVDKDVEIDYANVLYEAKNERLECPGEIVAEKPIIYIYPEEDMNVEVKLGNPGLIRNSYPKYETGWNVFARKDGTLEINGREYYGLYWEGNNYNIKAEKEGFVVKGEDTSEFLEEKLEILGLNEREINEFIIYWLPRMEKNNYNYIRFATEEEINNYMPLEITPTPDSLIRVYMSYKPLDEKIDIEEQILTKTERVGYSVVEWGGSVIDE